MGNYTPSKIEPKWQKIWQKSNFQSTTDFSVNEKKYILVEFPYPSGAGLHVGHVWGYTMGDVIARYCRMNNKNVLLPMGWDAFGLPAENYAIKTGIHPSITVSQNIKTFKKQMNALGFSFDWSREINTAEPLYYKWTQWIFLQFFKKGLAYKKEIAINWCSKCKLGLADEEVLLGGIHERCGSKVTRRLLSQWLLKITAYADCLLEGLKDLDWPDEIKQQQVNWIGRSEGAEIEWEIESAGESVSTFTTRLDTIYGATFLVLAPEHPFLKKLKLPNKVQEYIQEADKKSELIRKEEEKDKTGVDTGLKAIYPLTGEKIPIWVADFVLMDVGTGAIMGVPAHDERDFAFAKKFDLPVKVVIQPSHLSYPFSPSEIFIDEGILINSGKFTGLTSVEARQKILGELSKRGLAKEVVTYHLRDWVFSRQHYWGEPIPMINCERCGWVPVPEENLPVELPYVEKYEPTETGESPLAVIKEWVEVTCPECRGPARRETDTMPNWAGSSWYYLRYCDPQNSRKLADLKKLEYYLPIDLYIGGAEHTTLHLLYSRFWYEFLFDLGLVPTKEPYQARVNRGIILGEDHRKMSKSFGNVVNPDDVVKEYGADTLRMYELFLGPINGTFPWNTQGVKGVRRFLDRAWGLVSNLSLFAPSFSSQPSSPSPLEKKLNQIIKKVGEDIENLKFNTAIAAMMEFVNDWQANPSHANREIAKRFLLILAPFAPHIAEELWQEITRQEAGNRKQDFVSIHIQPWPKYEASLIKEKIITIVVQVNGRLREKLEISANDSQDQEKVERLARSSAKIEKYLSGKAIKNVIFVPGKLINFVTTAQDGKI